MSSEEFISIIIPAYNEEKRIEKTLINYTGYFDKEYSGKYELLIILNGCRDRTEEVVKKYSQVNSRVNYVDIQEAVGKGGAIKEGLKIAGGSLIGYTDADGSTSPEMMHRLFGVLSFIDSVDSVIGSRNIPGSIVTGKNWRRKVMSYSFNFLVNFLFNLNIADTQCGAKVIRRHIVTKILPNLTISNMAFDVNFLVDVRSVGGVILEIPIDWSDDTDSTIKSPIKTSLAMAVEVVKLRFKYWFLKKN
jgi:glycosyltransferase involved in cell wall biosynthesis